MCTMGNLASYEDAAIASQPSPLYVCIYYTIGFSSLVVAGFIPVASSNIVNQSTLTR